MKRCSRCRLEKELNEFCKDRTKKDGLSPRCKKCSRESQRQWYSKPENVERDRENKKRYRAENRRFVLDLKKRWRKANPERYRKSIKRWEAQHAERVRSNDRRWYLRNLERVREKGKSWRASNKERIKEYFRNRRKTDPLFKLRKNLSNCLNRVLRVKSWNKNFSIKDIIGCSLEELYQHLGPAPDFDYHIDHICPCAQAQTEEEMYKLFHYTNLRYCPAAENLSKLDSWTEEGEKLCLVLLNRPWIWRVSDIN